MPAVEYRLPDGLSIQNCSERWKSRSPGRAIGIEVTVYNPNLHRRRSGRKLAGVLADALAAGRRSRASSARTRRYRLGALNRVAGPALVVLRPARCCRCRSRAAAIEQAWVLCARRWPQVTLIRIDGDRVGGKGSQDVMTRLLAPMTLSMSVCPDVVWRVVVRRVVSASALATIVLSRAAARVGLHDPGTANCRSIDLMMKAMVLLAMLLVDFATKMPMALATLAVLCEIVLSRCD